MLAVSARATFGMDGTSLSTLTQIFPLGKSDVDHIFGLEWQGWESYVKAMALPVNWETTFQRHTTGTGLVALDKETGAMLVICPTYPAAHGMPVRLTITLAYPQGQQSARTNRLVQMLQDTIQYEMGSAYLVTVANTNAPASHIVEVSVARRAAA